MFEYTLAYTLLDLTSAVQDDLKDPSFSTTRIRRYLNYGQQVIFATHDFRFCEKSVSGVLTIGEYNYDQQPDHETTIGGVLVDPVHTTQYIILDEKNYLGHRDFFDKYPYPAAVANNSPTSWTEFGNQFFFNCPVSKAYTFVQRYNRIPTDMDTDTSVPDLPATFRELLELYADYRGEKYRGNHDVAATYLQAFEDGLEAKAIKYAATTAMGPAIARQTRRRV